MRQSSYLCSHSYYHFIAVLLISVIFKSITAMRPSPVTVNKCCNENQILDINEPGHQCIIDDNSSINWWPLIVLAKKQTFFEPHGSAPRFLKFQEHQPICKNPEFINGPHKMVLYSNGTLYLSERHKYIEQLEHYCIDKSSAIVCDPNATNIYSTKKTLKKCCAQDAVYKLNQSICIQTDNNINVDRSILSNSIDYDVQYGFPTCENSKYFSFELNEFNYDRDLNRLVLKTGQTLAWNEYCLENVMGDNETDLERDMRVFMCADHLSTTSNAMVTFFQFYMLIHIHLILCFFHFVHAGHTLYLISNWAVDIGCIFIGHISHTLRLTYQSSHTSLALSNISRGVLIDWRSSLGIRPTIWI